MKSASNIVDIAETSLKKYIKLKEGEKIKGGDFVHLYDTTYAKLSKESLVCKNPMNKYNVILRENNAV
jgi:hypothetical protein